MDIASTDSGGYMVGWLRDTEYMRYTIDVISDGGCGSVERARRDRRPLEEQGVTLSRNELQTMS